MFEARVAHISVSLCLLLVSGSGTMSNLLWPHGALSKAQLLAVGIFTYKWDTKCKVGGEPSQRLKLTIKWGPLGTHIFQMGPLESLWTNLLWMLAFRLGKVIGESSLGLSKVWNFFHCERYIYAFGSQLVSNKIFYLFLCLNILSKREHITTKLITSSWILLIFYWSRKNKKCNKMFSFVTKETKLVLSVQCKNNADPLSTMLPYNATLSFACYYT